MKAAFPTPTQLPLFASSLVLIPISQTSIAPAIPPTACSQKSSIIAFISHNSTLIFPCLWAIVASTLASSPWVVILSPKYRTYPLCLTLKASKYNWIYLQFSPTRPSGPSWFSSCKVCLCVVCLCVCVFVPFPCYFFALSDWCRACLVHRLVRFRS